ncbi:MULTISPECIES: proline--tRNA ligase [unclassified Treponema]|uniref:proline--tRNA ligase n=1 Tax=unclassified Treponema TaxID=2638727 RepID=UPI0025D3774F|nr:MULTISPECIES: proline--tRNA ligase [unclassified Treponema]
MKTSQIPFRTLRDSPSEAIISSHQLMMRADLIRKLGNGLYTYMPLGLRAYRKLEKIIKEEIEASGAMEFKPTVIVPGDIWKESGRWETMGPQMLKAQNRQQQDMVVSPTAEEAYTAIMRQGLTSYKQLPINCYQINTKYRDEIRPRYGVMRGREFNMMDGYTLNADDESLDQSYQAYAKAYLRIFKRLGLNVITVKADTGAMGGSGSEEFMVESEIGDDTLILCKCGYAANVEKASCAKDIPVDIDGNPVKATEKNYEPISTPNVGTIDDLEKHLKCSKHQLLKTLIYKATNVCLDLSELDCCKNLKTITEGNIKFYPEVFVAVCIRGDLDINEAKLAGFLKASEVELATAEEDTKITGAPVGFAGPINLSSVPVIADNSVLDMHDFLVGANKADTHFVHVEYGRDFSAWKTADLRTAKAGDICPVCGKPFYTTKGNELGHIFKLGKKYTESMNVTYLDKNGKSAVPTMGCYGIGVDRVLASIIESFHDDRGIIWPMSTAPYQVAIVPIKYSGAMKEAADKIYDELLKAGVEVLLDDRDERPGVKFNDMDLIGFPVRITVGDKNLPNIEIKMRSSEQAELVPLENAAAKASEIVKAEFDKLNS